MIYVGANNAGFMRLMYLSRLFFGKDYREEPTNSNHKRNNIPSIYCLFVKNSSFFAGISKEKSGTYKPEGFDSNTIYEIS